MPHRRDVLKQFGGTLAIALASGVRTLAEDKPARPRIKIGQIGVGHAHASKLSVYRESPDYEVVGIVEPDAELRKRAESRRTVSRPALDDARAAPEYARPAGGAGRDARPRPARHGRGLRRRRQARPPRQAGRRVAAAVSRASSTTAAKQKLLVQMGYMYRYNPAVVLLREFLKRGWLGEVFEVHAVMSKVVAPPDAASLAEYPRRHHVRAGLPRHRPGRRRARASRTQVTPFTRHVASARRHACSTTCWPCSTTRGRLATVKSSALEVEGVERRHLVVCGTEGTFHIQPLDNPAARVALSQPRGEYRRGYQDVKFPKYTRYVADAADMARIIRGEKASDFPYEHDLAVQTRLAPGVRPAARSIKPSRHAPLRCRPPLSNASQGPDDGTQSHRDA